MKLNALILTIAMLPAVAAGAQEGLSVNGLFNGPYRDNVHATETVISAGALDKEVAFRNGRLYYGYYTLKPMSDGELNRYLFYLNQHAVGKDKLILIYIEGKAGRADVKKMLKK